MINFLLLTIAIFTTVILFPINLFVYLLRVVSGNESFSKLHTYSGKLAHSIDQTGDVLYRNFFNWAFRNGGIKHGDGDLTISCVLGMNYFTGNLLPFGKYFKSFLGFIDLRNKKEGKDHCTEAVIAEYFKAKEFIALIESTPELNKLVSEQRP